MPGNFYAILDLCRYLHLFPGERTRFDHLLSHNKKLQGTLTGKIQDAFHFFGLELSNDGDIRLAGAFLCRLDQLCPRDVRPVLQQLARHACYSLASQQSRKDFRAPEGFLDFWLSTSFSRQKDENNDDIPSESLF